MALGYGPLMALQLIAFAAFHLFRLTPIPHGPTRPNNDKASTQPNPAARLMHTYGKWVNPSLAAWVVQIAALLMQVQCTEPRLCYAILVMSADLHKHTPSCSFLTVVLELKSISNSMAPG